MSGMRQPKLLLGALALTSCAPMSTVAPPAPSGAANCPIASTDWAAWVNGMPGPNARPTLIITGKVTVPTGGYRFAWRDLRVMESYPVQVAVDLEAMAPAGAATQAVVTQDVRGQWPITPPVGALSIYCGGRVLARISPVETAQ
jgi:hypothetical protein